VAAHAFEPDLGRARIDAHALVGGCRGAALVDGRGAVDWLAWPRFDSDPIFASLLDANRGGTFGIAPRGVVRSSVRYLDETNVAVTRFETTSGSLELLDLEPVDRDGAHDLDIAPEHELLRVARCLAGRVVLDVTLDPRSGFGARAPRANVDRRGDVRWEDRGAVYMLRSTHRTDRPIELRAGDRVVLSLSYAREGPLVLRSLDETDAAIARTIEFWRSWAGRARYDGPHREAVVRSALALKLLCYAPSGAIVAAPTTSLPELRGGDRNWDYRFCWLRDAASRRARSSGSAITRRRMRSSIGSSTRRASRRRSCACSTTSSAKGRRASARSI